MIRILHVVTYMGRGGLETMLMNYYRQIDRQRLQFDFLVHRQERADYDDEIESLGGMIHRLPRLNPWDPGYLKALDRFFTEHPEYTIVHSHLDCMSAIPLRAAQKAGVPVRIAHSHSSNQDKDLKYPLKLYYKRKIGRYATKLFACSDAAGQWMFGAYPFEMMPNAINAKLYTYDPEKRSAMREKLGLRDTFVLGHVGRFHPPKNHGFLIDIFAEVYRREPKARLVLAGGGSGMEEIREKCKRLGLEAAVIFLGVRSDVNEILQAMDVFLLPSLYEGLPVTTVEAQASGLPCLISDKVPIACKVTDLVEQVCLSDGPIVWADKIFEARQIARRNTFGAICAAGFDIGEEAEKLTGFYLSAGESR